MPAIKSVRQKIIFSVLANLLVVGLGSSVSARAEQASFDCAGATLVDEKIICSDPLLSQADYQLGNSYKALMASMAGQAQQEALRADQHNWLLTRNRECALTKHTKVSDENRPLYADCLLAAYEERAADLEDIKANPDKKPADISTPIRKSQHEAAVWPLAAAEALAFSGIKTKGESFLAWVDEGRIAVLAKPVQAHSAHLYLWKLGQAPDVVADGMGDLTEVRRLCVVGDDLVVIRKKAGSAEPMAARFSTKVLGQRQPVSWAALSPELAASCRFDRHRHLVGKDNGSGYLDLGPREISNQMDDRFVRLFKDGVVVPMNPVVRSDRRFLMRADYLPKADVFVVSHETRSANMTAEDLRRWAKSNCLPFWQIAAATGAATRVCIPYGASVKSAPEPFISTAGLFYLSRDAGIYRVEGLKASPLLATNDVTASALSPDQCLLAYTGAYPKGKLPSVQVFDFCKASRQK